jgi:hypothetical protein
VSGAEWAQQVDLESNGGLCLQVDCGIRVQEEVN